MNTATALKQEPQHDMLMVTVPETTLNNGMVVPSFQVSQYHASKNGDGTLIIDSTQKPWAYINYDEAIAAAQGAGYQLITESQYLAIATNIAAQDDNWTGGKVGEGHIYKGIHAYEVSEAQAGDYKPTGKDERNWHVLSNGGLLYNFAGNIYSWVFDDIQGDEQGLVAKEFASDSPSVTSAPFPSMEKGMGWYPKAGADWSGCALVRGGFWHSDDLAGVFRLGDGWREYRFDYVGFRCTKSL